MDNEKDFSGLSMDEIVFDHRNKRYGAYLLRSTYQKHLLKALCISFSLFIFGLYTPKMAKAIGLFPDKPPVEEKIDTILLFPPIEKIFKLTKDNEEHKKGGGSDADKELEAAKNVTEPLDTTQTEENQNPGKHKPGEGNGDTTSYSNSGFEPDTNSASKPDIPSTPPEFFGGEEELIRFLREHLIYPENLLEDGIEGVTVISFVVSKDGKVEEVSVVNTSGYIEFDREAKRVIYETSYKFKPGKRNGKAARSVCQIPITFEILDE